MRDRAGGETGAYVVDVLNELKKVQNEKSARELAAIYQDIFGRLGGLK